MKNRGFSLIELIIVLVLMSLSIALITPSLSRLSKTTELKGIAQKVSGILRYCRSESVNKAKVYQVLFDSNLREVKVQSVEVEEKGEGEKGEEKVAKRYPLPEGIHIKEVEVPPPKYPSDLPTIEFYPNGGSNGGSILLNRDDRKGYRIKVHFLTGIVEIEKI